MYEKFRALIEARGITPYKVAVDCDMSPNTMYDWKAGRSNPKADKLKKLADYFGVTIDYFLE